MKILKISATLFVLSFFFAIPAMAQLPPPPSGAGGPIDGGAVALVVGCALYGYKQLKEDKAKKDE